MLSRMVWLYLEFDTQTAPFEVIEFKRRGPVCQGNQLELSYYDCIESRNSEFAFVLLSLSSSNSIASVGES